MDAISDFAAAKILCVDPDSTFLERRCAVLRYSGYDAVSVSPGLAEIYLSRQKFDLIVMSMLSDSDVERITNRADGAEVLVLDGITFPSELLALVSQRLNRRRRTA